MKEKTKALKAAFPLTIPILTSFLILGIAYGILMSDKGYGVIWSVLMSAIVYAGTVQYMAITFFTTVFNPFYAFLMTLMVNARYLFYGISLLEKYKNTGKLKPYLIFGLCDETFSIVCSTDTPEGVNENYFIFFITFLNRIYWILGTALGGILGSQISFNTKGLDFALTALFIVIFIDQWKSQKDHRPSLIGIFGSLISLFIFGKSNFIIPSMIVIIIMLKLLQKDYEKNNEDLEEEIECS